MNDADIDLINKTFYPGWLLVQPVAQRPGGKGRRSAVPTGLPVGERRA